MILSGVRSTTYFFIDGGIEMTDDLKAAVELMEHSYFPDQKREAAKNLLIRHVDTGPKEFTVAAFKELINRRVAEEIIKMHPQGIRIIP